jgi:hypothetical protein
MINRSTIIIHLLSMILGTVFFQTKCNYSLSLAIGAMPTLRQQQQQQATFEQMQRIHLQLYTDAIMAFLGAVGDQLYQQLNDNADHQHQLNYCLLTIDYSRKEDMIARAAQCLTIAIDQLNERKSRRRRQTVYYHTQLKELPPTIADTSIARVLSSLTDIVRERIENGDRPSSRSTKFNESYRRLVQVVDKLDSTIDPNERHSLAMLGSSSSSTDGMIINELFSLADALANASRSTGTNTNVKFLSVGNRCSRQRSYS